MTRDVLLPRLHLFEFNDQAWASETLRSMITSALGEGFETIQGGKLLGSVLADLVRESGTASILELAAGSAQASVELANELHQRGQTMPYVVSDKFPDIDAFRRASRLSLGRIQFIEQPVDVLEIPRELRGLRLLLTSFHHFRPEQAARLLQDSYDKRIPIAIFELTDRGLLSTLIRLPLGIVTMILHAPTVFRDHSWRGLLWLLPTAAAYGFDGVVSCLRSYTLSEFASMTQSLNDGYSWRMGFIPTAFPIVKITYLLGGPSASHLTTLALDATAAASARPPHRHHL